MNSILKQMMEKHDNNIDKIYIIKQVIQENILSSLSHTDFFDHTAFYGGTALRIFYDLDRFSEDLDFSLIKKDEEFNIEKYLKEIKDKLYNYGLAFEIYEKKKTNETNILSAFVKGNTKETIMQFDILDDTILSNEIIKIKIEVDTNPPDGATFEKKYILLPNNSCINMYDEPSLFAGKLHAVICRAWKNRVKGRDLYDYLFYLSRKSKINYAHLRNRLIDSRYVVNKEELESKDVKDMLVERFDTLDFRIAKEDVLPFINDKHKIDLWNKDLFISITKDYFD